VLGGKYQIKGFRWFLSGVVCPDGGCVIWHGAGLVALVGSVGCLMAGNYPGGWVEVSGVSKRLVGGVAVRQGSQARVELKWCAPRRVDARLRGGSKCPLSFSQWCPAGDGGQAVRGLVPAGLRW